MLLFWVGVVVRRLRCRIGGGEELEEEGEGGYRRRLSVNIHSCQVGGLAGFPVRSWVCLREVQNSWLCFVVSDRVYNGRKRGVKGEEKGGKGEMEWPTALTMRIIMAKVWHLSFSLARRIM